MNVSQGIPKGNASEEAEEVAEEAEDGGEWWANQTQMQSGQSTPLLKTVRLSVKPNIVLFVDQVSSLLYTLIVRPVVDAVIRLKSNDATYHRSLATIVAHRSWRVGQQLRPASEFYSDSFNRILSNLRESMLNCRDIGMLNWSCVDKSATFSRPW